MPLEKYKLKRNFNKTNEPGPKPKKSIGKMPIFVIQKHQASHLHFDLRLEADKNLKSWAVPKGLSMDTKDKRLAIKVEDHPLEYAYFEGQIPQGNYGAGEVIVWDRGNYQVPKIKGRKKTEESVLSGLRQGKITIKFQGKKIKGEFHLFRIKKDKEKEQWIIKKQKDNYANKKISDNDKSVISKKTLKQIANSSHALWIKKEIKFSKKEKMPDKISPMLSKQAKEAFNQKDWLFEIKWDGFRSLAFTKKNPRLISRNQNIFKNKFPSILNQIKKINDTLILDGEIIAVDSNGKAKFELLQDYIKTGRGEIVYYVFDLLHYNGYNIRNLNLEKRKEILKNILPDLSRIKFVDHIYENGIDFFKAAKQNSLEGIMAKKINSKYLPGKRTSNWLKIKVLNYQEAIICGYTQPRGSREYIGALILGVYNKNKLEYIGLVGGGLSVLGDLKKFKTLLDKLKIKVNPFAKTIKTDMPIVWLKPELVCEVKFSNWTESGRLRQPILKRLRPEIAAHSVKIN